MTKSVSKILIVDDEPINILLIQSLLKGKYELVTAKNGQEAYDIVKQGSIDLVLLDVMMPVLDGFETLSKIKSNAQTSSVAVIMVTAKVEKEDVRKALKLGASDYIKKPVDATELYTKIDIHQKLLYSEEKLSEYQVYANIHESMVTAQRIQNALLPDKHQFSRIFPNAFLLYLPKDMISGDFYFIHQLQHKKFIFVFDATGHGVPAALLTLIINSSLHWIVKKQKITDPLKVATLLHNDLEDLLLSNEDTYTSAKTFDGIFCEFDMKSRELSYVSIGRPLVLVRENSNQIVYDDKVRGAYAQNENHSLFYIRSDYNSVDKENYNQYHSHKLKLEKTDYVYLFSDGYTDQFGGEDNKKFSKKQLVNTILEFQTLNIRSQKLSFYKRLASWSDNHERTDDVILLGINF